MFLYHIRSKTEPPHDKTNIVVSAPSEDSDQPEHPPSLIRVVAVRMKIHWVLNYPLRAQQRLWSEWVDAQADLNLRWAHRSFCWFCHEVAQMLSFNKKYGKPIKLHKWFILRYLRGWNFYKNKLPRKFSMSIICNERWNATPKKYINTK